MITPRQIEILSRWMAGKELKQIAEDLHLSHKTIQFHWAKLQRALGLYHPALIAQRAMSLLRPQ